MKGDMERGDKATIILNSVTLSEVEVPIPKS